MRELKTSDKYGYDSPVWERSYADRSQAEWSLLMLMEIEAISDAHFWLSEEAGSRSKARGYEIVIGASRNSSSFIRRGKQGTDLASKFHLAGEGPLSGKESKKFWLSFVKTDANVTLVIGAGWEPGKHKVIFAIDSSNRRMDIETISVSTGFGSVGRWTIVSVKVGAAQDAFNSNRLVEVVTPGTPPLPSISQRHATPIRETLVAASSTGLLKRRRASISSTPQQREVQVPSDSALFRRSVNRAMDKFSQI